MDTIYHNCCGLDVHKDSVVACILNSRGLSENNPDLEKYEKEIRDFEVFPCSLAKLKDWLIAENCRIVDMESTGVYWLPVYLALEDAFDGEFELLFVNARHMKNVPGKKTNINDAEWIAKLLLSGLLKGSFVPLQEIRELRYLERYRKTGESIAEKSEPFSDAIKRLTTISGISITAATAIVGEIGTDMSKFPTVSHLSSWAGL